MSSGSAYVADDIVPSASSSEVADELIAAAAEGNAQACEELLLRGADPSSMDALHAAALEGHHGVVEVLLSTGRAALTASDASGWGALHNALLSGGSALAMVETLVRARADVQQQNSNGETPLHWVHKADSKHDWKIVRGRTADGRSSFFAPAIVQTLLEAGARVNTPDAAGRTALHAAAAAGASSTVMALCHARADVNAFDAHGRTALQLARASTVDHLRRIEGLLLAEASGAVNVQGYSLCGMPSMPIDRPHEDDSDDECVESEVWATALRACPISLPPRSRTPSPPPLPGHMGSCSSASGFGSSKQSPQRAIFSPGRKRSALQANIDRTDAE